MAAIIPVRFMMYFSVGWFGHVSNCICLDGVVLIASLADHEAQVLAKQDAKDALARVKFLASPEAVEGLLEVGYETFLIFCLDDHIIDVSLNMSVEWCCETTLDCLLVGGIGVFQPEGYGVVAVDTEGHYERYLILVGKVKGDRVIA